MPKVLKWNPFVAIEVIVDHLDPPPECSGQTCKGHMDSF